MEAHGARRNPWVAGLLSLLLPGLGQMYNGQVKKGVWFYCLTGVVPFALLPVIIGLPLAPVNIVVPVLMCIGIYLYNIVDARRIARKLDNTYQRQTYNKWYIYLGVIVIAWYVVQPALAFSVRRFLVQAFKIPAGSMEQTLLIGDHILVNKFLKHFMSPRRFDIIVFQYPWEEDRDFIKRVIGLPGDTVELRNRQVYVNGQPLEEPYAQYAPGHSREQDFGPVVIPKKGDVVEIRNQHLYLNGEPVSIPSSRFYPRDRGMAMTGFEVFYSTLSGFAAGTTLDQPAGPFTVQHDYYFMLGDNRDNSKDSRYWGFVKSERIKGKAAVIYWSWNRSTQQVRWGRIGMSVQ